MTCPKAPNVMPNRLTMGNVLQRLSLTVSRSLRSDAKKQDGERRKRKEPPVQVGRADLCASKGR